MAKDNCKTEALKLLEKGILGLGRGVNLAIYKLGDYISEGNNKVVGSRLRDILNEEIVALSDNLKRSIEKEKIVNEDQLKNIKMSLDRKVGDLIGIIRSVKNNTEMLESIMEGSDRIQAVNGIVGRMFQYYDNITSREENLFVAQEVTYWKEIERGGRLKNPDDSAKAKEYMMDAQAGGELLNDYLRDLGHSDPHRYIFESIKRGTAPDAPVLDIIVGVLAKLKEYKNAKLKNDYPNYATPQSDFSYRVDLAKIYDADEFVEVMKDSIDPYPFLGITRDQYNEIVKSEREAVVGKSGKEGAFGTTEPYFKSMLRELHRELIEPKINPYNIGRRSAISGRASFGKIKFLDNQKEYEFMKRFADTRGGLIGSHRNFLKSQLGGAGSEAVMSKDPQAVFVSMRDVLLKKYKDQTKRGVEDIDQILEPYLEEFRDRRQPKNVVNEDLANIRTTALQGISGLLLGKSPVRNIAHDNTVHASLVHAANTGDDVKGIYTWLERSTELSAALLATVPKSALSIPKATWDVFVKGKAVDEFKLSKAKEELKEIFQEQGLVIDVQMNAAVAGVRRHKFDIEPIVSDKKDGLWSRFWSGAARRAEAFARTTSVLSGADATNKLARIDAAIKSGGLLERMFRNAEWDKLERADKVLLLNNGVNKNMFNVLKRVKRNQYGIVSAKEFETIDVKELVNPPLVTERQARKDVEFRYHHLINTMMDEISPLPSVQSEVTWARGVKKNTGPGTLIALAFKFSNIGKSAYIGMHRPLRRRAGLDPNEVNSDPLNYIHNMPMHLELAKKNPMYLGRAVIGSALGGMMINWSSELSNNEPLSAITPGFIAKGLLRTSAIGYVGELANNVYWGSGLVGDTTESVFKMGKDIGRAGLAGAMGEFEAATQKGLQVKRTFPITNIWWTGLILDQGIRKGFDVPYTDYQKKKFEDRGNLKEQFEEFVR